MAGGGAAAPSSGLLRLPRAGDFGPERRNDLPRQTVRGAVAPLPEAAQSGATAGKAGDSPPESRASFEPDADLPPDGMDAARQDRDQRRREIESRLRTLFPASPVRLSCVCDDLRVEGQAKDEKEASKIMAVVRQAAALGSGAAQPGAAESTIPPGGAAPLAALRVKNMLRVPQTRKLALRVRVLQWDRAAGNALASDARDEAAQTNALVRSLLDASSAGAAALLDSRNSADLDRLVTLLAGQKVLAPLYEQTLTTESGRPVTLIARGVIHAQTANRPGGNLAGATARPAEDLMITCLPAVADKERIRLKVAAEIGMAARSADTSGNSRVQHARAVAMVMREGQTLAIAGLGGEAPQPQMPGPMSFLSQVLEGKTVAAGSKDLVVTVTPQLAPCEQEQDLIGASSPGK